MRGGEHAYKMISITSWHSRAKPGHLQQSLELADAQVHTWQNRWSLVSDSKTTRHLKLSIDINKRKTVDSLFQAVRDKLGKQGVMHGSKVS
jgi:hypothetical protein